MIATTFIAKNFKTIVWSAVTALVMFFLMRSCHGYKLDQKYAQWKQEAQKEILAVKQAYEKEKTLRVQDSIANARARSESEAAIADAKQANEKVEESAATIRRLTQSLAYFKAHDVDSSFVPVHPGYIRDCDSLGLVAERQQREIEDARREVVEAGSLLQYEIVLRDQQIEREKEYSAMLLASFNAQSVRLKNALDMGKPRGSLWGGITAVWSESAPVAGAGVTVAYQSKGGKQYQVSPQFIKTPDMETPELIIQGTLLFKF